jgi:RNA polymerase sigma factor (sigma-70 family)
MPRTAIPNEEIVAPARRAPDEPAAPARRSRVGAHSSCALRDESDSSLVALTRAGSERAFAEIMRRYQRPLYVYSLQLLGAGRAEDAVQQAFLQAFISLRDGAPREIALRPWLYRIARNCSIDLLRKPGSDHDQLDPEYDGMPQPPGVLEQKEELAKLVEAILALPEGQRRALTLRELEGRSYGEISAELGHTSSGVRQLIFRARTALRNLAGIAFPFGSLRWQLLGQGGPAPAEPHQLATVAGVSAPAGGGALQAVGSILAATVTLAAGGGAGAQAHRAAERPAAIQAPASSNFAAAAPALLLGVRPKHRATGKRGEVSGGDAGGTLPESLPLAPPDVPLAPDPSSLAAVTPAAASPVGASQPPVEPSSDQVPAATSPTVASTAGASGQSDGSAIAPQKAGVTAAAETTAAPSPTGTGSGATGPSGIFPKPPSFPAEPAKGTRAPVKTVKPAKPPIVKAPAAKAPKSAKAPLAAPPPVSAGK